MTNETEQNKIDKSDKPLPLWGIALIPIYISALFMVIHSALLFLLLLYLFSLMDTVIYGIKSSHNSFFLFSFHQVKKEIISDLK